MIIAKPIGTCARIRANSAPSPTRPDDQGRHRLNDHATMSRSVDNRLDHDRAPQNRVDAEPERRNRNLQDESRFLRARHLGGVEPDLPGQRRRAPRRPESPTTTSSTRPSAGIDVRPSRMVMLPRSIMTTGMQHAIATAIARPPRSRTPSIGWFAIQRIRPSASVMTARPIRADETEHRRARASQQAPCVRAHASMHGYFCRARTFRFRRPSPCTSRRCAGSWRPRP